MATSIADEKPVGIHLEASETQEHGNQGVQLSEEERAAEKKLLRKIDLHLVPILWCLYLLAFLDRTNSLFAFTLSSDQTADIASQSVTLRFKA